MIVIGAKGFAKEVLEVLYHQEIIPLKDLIFFDNVTQNGPDLLYNTYPILKSYLEVSTYFKNTNNTFTIGIGNPYLRNKLAVKFKELGGELVSTISAKAEIGRHNVIIGKGCNILCQSVISNDVTIGEGVIIYFNALITHDVTIGDYVEVSPNAVLLGHCEIGDFSQIGSGATILNGVKIGKGVVVAAGAVVTKNVPNNCMVAGVPAVIKKMFN
ncbi:NeuD/PglB/VioB family sugar acetyltransferase [Oceanihabitans sp. 2_MG-2023]|uniref:NeuD/PglB/VioB family sugar acetyltransferase n=1 Tax=Oceanihabitans sp. 2_MG-2023 TaxID=3062661 RepID=UPI0026E1A153|nr:NeuD/PglB/VioB family sugar acetyltransferase [Oceanihabitans sp. 2_MG-2023]MDO6597681.1 NeuD/PglB/VioB family sugar acetyltransferase [Oceanihabitans sp. 2_MG-2023]